ncbi:MAG: glycerol-3-phosphate 1-O-acyltransferase PlsY [Acholeplasmataceae bacterium]
MIVFGVISFLLLSYFVGAIPNGLIIGKIFRKIDIRAYGSKNTGATNAVRVLGIRLGSIAFLLDILKGVFVVSLLTFAKLDQFYLLFGGKLDIRIIYGFIAAVGHVLPIYLDFRGGKAVATSGGAVFAIEWTIGLFGLIVFAIIVLKTKFVSLASTITSAIIVLLFILRIFFLEFFNLTIETYLLEVGLLIGLGTIIMIRHKTNFKRLKEGKENQFTV